MTLIKSVSGIRGTIGGKPGDNLTPLDLVKFASAFGTWILKRSEDKTSVKIVIGRDARISGEIVSNLVISCLQSLGITVINLELSTTPTVEFAVTEEKANGGIILTASHNPKQWNALKLLNEKGEFISKKDGEEVLTIAEKGKFDFAGINELGKVRTKGFYIRKHIRKIATLKLVDIKSITEKKFKVVVDGVNSSGGVAVPKLLRAIGVNKIVKLNCEPTGRFAHDPEPLPHNLSALCSEVKQNNADLGIAVDPDVDRLVFVSDDGVVFGEEYTLVAIADYVLRRRKGNTVSNLSSTRALKDITVKRGGEHFSSAVGEVHVVEKMKEVNAVIGGEGNGGVIYPELHYGRDALVGIALFLSHLARSNKTCSGLRLAYPNYFISKNKVSLSPDIDVDKVLKQIQKKYSKNPNTTIDGLKIDFDENWVHLRKSNTEPIIRIYAESQNENIAVNIAKQIINDIRFFSNGKE